MPRLLHSGRVILELVMDMSGLPLSDVDVLTRSASLEAGNGFDVMATAACNDTPVAMVSAVSAVWYVGRDRPEAFV
ncbi:hypothetical protein [Pseudomonas piscis]|uniref:hypothetical protein n=1 Tax=Pseudomonas piscis TaxID=2614538 RepID=UPI0021D61533|nr:hypothetical protein [Pseudomonas piscis]MCU7645347.1 hypothetical protein [Pseudomonas piscis]